jgi:hypothetical protein
VASRAVVDKISRPALQGLDVIDIVAGGLQFVIVTRRVGSSGNNACCQSDCDFPDFG